MSTHLCHSAANFTIPAADQPLFDLPRSRRATSGPAGSGRLRGKAADCPANHVGLVDHLKLPSLRTQDLRARPRRRGLPKDNGERSVIADNALDRRFAADRPNQKWVALVMNRALRRPVSDADKLSRGRDTQRSSNRRGGPVAVLPRHRKIGPRRLPNLVR